MDRRRLGFPAALALILLAGCATAAGEEVARERLLADVRYLAADELEGRGTGTPGGEKAAEYIRAELEEAGLYAKLQELEVTAGVALGPKNALRLHGTTYAVNEDFSPLGFSAVGAFRGGLVFAGYGLSLPDRGYDDYEGLDVKGKVVLILDGVPGGRDDPHSPFADVGIHAGLRFKAIAARDRGAAAVLFVSREKGVTREQDPALLGPMADTTHGDVGIPVIDTRRYVADLYLDTRQERIDTELAPSSTSLEPTRVEGSVDLVKERRKTANVYAVLPGESDEAIVVGAHYDHLGRGHAEGSLADPKEREAGAIHNGADDNASGVAAMLEVARALAAVPTPRRTVIFVAFAAEELGLHGATYFVKTPPVPLEKIVAMLNMDMVGRMKGRKIAIGGAGTAAEWDGVIERAAAGLELEIGRDPSGFGPSDHSAFFQRNIPVFFLFTGPHADYHKPSDDTEKINGEGLEIAARLARALVREVDALPARPTFTRPAGSAHAAGGDEMRGRGPAVYLGTVPDAEAYVGETKDGVLLGGVNPGSPAEKAGLKAGDKIVRFDGHEVRDVYDYTKALFSRKPGDKVEIVVVRGGAGERVTVTATLGRKDGR